MHLHSNKICFQNDSQVHEYFASLCLTWICVTLFIIFELQQFIKVSIKEKSLIAYFNLQNVVEDLLIIAIIIFLSISSTHVELASHLSGWILLVGWANLTIYIGKLASFGETFYNSLFLAKKTVGAMTVFLPSLFGFTCAFHIFDKGNSNFRTMISSILKVFTMFTGEFDYEDNFTSDKVKADKGRNISLQVSKQVSFEKPSSTKIDFSDLVHWFCSLWSSNHHEPLGCTDDQFL